MSELEQGHALSDFWKTVNEYLTVVASVSENEITSIEQPVTVEFTVENSAPIDGMHPEVFFEEVLLHVGIIGEDFHVETISNLASGQFHNYEHHCLYNELPHLQYSVESKISPDRFFKIRREATDINASRANIVLSPQSYLKALSGLRIHQWLEDVIPSLKSPGPDTTLSQVDDLKKEVATTQSQIKQAEGHIRELHGFLDAKYKDKFLPHRKLIEEYFKILVERISRLRGSLENTRQGTFDQVRNRDFRRPRDEAEKVNMATEQLMDQYQISDEEVGYPYRK